MAVHIPTVAVAVPGTRRVAPVIGLKARTASVLPRTPRNPKATRNLRNRCRARPKRVLVHIDLDVNVRLRLAIGHLEDRLRIMASRSKIGKLRDGGRTHRHGVDFRQDLTAPNLTSGGQGVSPRGFNRADRAVHQSEVSNDGTHETKSALLRRRGMGPQPGEGVP